MTIKRIYFEFLINFVDIKIKKPNKSWWFRLYLRDLDVNKLKIITFTDIKISKDETTLYFTTKRNDIVCLNKNSNVQLADMVICDKSIEVPFVHYNFCNIE